MEIQAIMQELEALGKERIKKLYIQQGAREPLFGVPTGVMKPIVKRVKKNQSLADALYETKNYDAMYLAGMVADPKAMTGADFDRWMEDAYFYMISDFIVAVTLSETDIAQEVADRWIASGKELYMSAGYSCYCWLLGNRKDGEFDREKLSNMLDVVGRSIHEQPNRARYAMNNFVLAIGISYVPLHEKALEVAKTIGVVQIDQGTSKRKVAVAAEDIQDAADKGKLGFKRRYVRC